MGLLCSELVMQLTLEETNVQGSAMSTHLYNELARANGRIAELIGQIAVLEYKLAQATTPKSPPQESPVE